MRCNSIILIALLVYLQVINCVKTRNKKGKLRPKAQPKEVAITTFNNLPVVDNNSESKDKTGNDHDHHHQVFHKFDSSVDYDDELDSELEELDEFEEVQEYLAWDNSPTIINSGRILQGSSSDCEMEGSDNENSSFVQTRAYKPILRKIERNGRVSKPKVTFSTPLVTNVQHERPVPPSIYHEKIPNLERSTFFDTNQVKDIESKKSSRLLKVDNANHNHNDEESTRMGTTLSPSSKPTINRVVPITRALGNNRLFFGGTLIALSAMCYCYLTNELSEIEGQALLLPPLCTNSVSVGYDMISNDEFKHKVTSSLQACVNYGIDWCFQHGGELLCNPGETMVPALH